MDLHWLTAEQLSAAYAAGRLSPVETTKHLLERIDRLDGKLNAVCHRDDEGSIAQAVASETRWKSGNPLSPLDGVPVLIKDLLLTQGWPTLRGSKTVDRNQRWDQDAPSVARLREAGCVLLAATTTPEFGWKGVTDSLLTGITRNPWDVTKTPGGSSGGSSAAVAAGYAPLSLGTDGGGSIRIPASFTGIFGLKPSFGRVPAYPLSPFGTVAHVGPMTRTVGDSALMMNEIAKPDARDWTSLPQQETDYAADSGRGVKGFRIAFSPALGYVDVDPEIADAVAQAVEVLRQLGASVTETDPGFSDPAACFRTHWWAGARALLGNLPEEKLALLDPDLRDVVEQSRKLTLDDYLGAQRERGALGSQMRQFMQGYDLLVTPTLPIAAFEAGRLAPGEASTGKWVNWTPFSYPFNLTQQPAASIPCGFTRSGLPIGLHVVGRMFEDKTVLSACKAYETATDWHNRHPSLAD